MRSNACRPSSTSPGAGRQRSCSTTSSNTTTAAYIVLLGVRQLDPARIAIAVIGVDQLRVHLELAFRLPRAARSNDMES